MASVYDFPEYYDILFGWDRDYEARVYAEVLGEHGVRKGCSVLEVAAGTAQVGIRLARSGFIVSALDMSASMLAFAAKAAEQQGTSILTLAADMAAFDCVTPFNAAINPMSSFRLLLDDDAAHAHLDCIIGALLPGAVYVIDLAFGTDGVAESDLDEWAMDRDGITVTATTHAVEVIDPARDAAPLILEWHESLRPYTPAAFEQLVGHHDDLSIVGCYKELDRDDDVSQFSTTKELDLPDRGRALVALARR